MNASSLEFIQCVIKPAIPESRCHSCRRLPRRNLDLYITKMRWPWAANKTELDDLVRLLFGDAFALELTRSVSFKHPLTQEDL